MSEAWTNDFSAVCDIAEISLGKCPNYVCCPPNIFNISFGTHSGGLNDAFTLDVLVLFYTLE